MRISHTLSLLWVLRPVEAFVPIGHDVAARLSRFEATPDSLWNAESVQQLKDTISNLRETATPSLMEIIDSDKLDLESNGPWALGVASIFIGIGQRNIGREEARRELFEKIGTGELDEEIEKVKAMAAEITAQRAEQERLKRELQEQLANEQARRDEEQKAEAAKLKAERERLMEEQRIKALEAAVIMEAELKQKEEERKARMAARQAKKEAARKKLEEESAAKAAQKEAERQNRIEKAAAIKAEKEAKLQVIEEERKAKAAAKDAEKKRLAEERRIKAEEANANKQAARQKLEDEKKAKAEEKAAKLKKVDDERKAKAAAAQDKQETNAKKIKDAKKARATKTVTAKRNVPSKEASTAKSIEKTIRTKSQDVEKFAVIPATESDFFVQVSMEEPPKPESSQSKQTHESSPAIVRRGPVKASPLAKVLANERGIDLDIISGTGVGGKVLASDVRDFKE